MSVWYRVRDLDAGTGVLPGHARLQGDVRRRDGRWAQLAARRHGDRARGGRAATGRVASVDVPDLKAEAERLRGLGVEVGVMLELHGACGS